MKKRIAIKVALRNGNVDGRSRDNRAGAVPVGLCLAAFRRLAKARPDGLGFQYPGRAWLVHATLAGPGKGRRLMRRAVARRTYQLRGGVND